VVFLLVGCGIVIVHPIDGTITKSGVTVYSEVKLNQNICGAPFRATLNGIDVTNKFSPLHPGANPLWTNFYNLPPGPYSLVVSADMEQGFPSSCSNSSNAVNFAVEETPYMEVCRKGGVPLPPNWAETGTQWELQLRSSINSHGISTNAYSVDWFTTSYDESI
jgi:hypothetical protein